MKLAYLLAGGLSSRFGSNKARVLIRGTPLLVSLATDLERLGWQVAAVAQGDRDYVDLGLRTIPDLHPNAGPIAGLLAALADCNARGGDHCLIANCDLIPGSSDWPKNWTWLLAMEATWSQAAPSIAVLETDRFLPLPGLYSVRLFETAQRLWEQGQRSLRALHEVAGIEIVRVACSSDQMPRTFNTPTELADLLEDEPDSNSIR